MKIAADISVINFTKEGMAVYTENLLSALLKTDKKNDYVFFNNHGLRRNNNKIFKNKEKFDFKKKIILKNFYFSQKLLYFCWHKFKQPQLNYFIGSADVFHSFNFLLPPIKANKKIITVYDLSFIYFPQFFSKEFHKIYTANISKSIKRADFLITLSQSAKQDICDIYNVKEKKIKVISGGVSKTFRDLKQHSNYLNKLQQLKKKYQIKNNYLLFVGTLQPRKNILNLIKAYSLLTKNLLNNYQLIIVGKKGWLFKNIFKYIKEKKLNQRIIFLENLENSELIYFYNGATMFILPSFYEGFGLPILEAFACGVPVITSNNSSLKEIAKDSALLIDPYSINEIKNAMLKLLKNKTLREELILKGKNKISTSYYNWGTSAKKLLKIYNS